MRFLSFFPSGILPRFSSGQRVLVENDIRVRTKFPVRNNFTFLIDDPKHAFGSNNLLVFADQVIAGRKNKIKLNEKAHDVNAACQIQSNLYSLFALLGQHIITSRAVRGVVMVDNVQEAFVGQHLEILEEFRFISAQIFLEYPLLLTAPFNEIVQRQITGWSRAVRSIGNQQALE